MTGPPLGELDDHALAGELARSTGALLTALRERSFDERVMPGRLRMLGDRDAHEHIVGVLAHARPDDAVLSEEGYDHPERLDADRVWIVDPLDGTSDYADPRSAAFAVHIAVVSGGRGVAAAVDLPVLGATYRTGAVELAERPEREPVVITNRSWGDAGYLVADALDGRLVACGSAGVKAMMVVSGECDVYVHDSGLYEWDVCAPAVVAQDAGLVVSDLVGNPFVFNRPRPVVQGFVVARREFAEATYAALRY